MPKKKDRKGKQFLIKSPNSKPIDNAGETDTQTHSPCVAGAVLHTALLIIH